MLYDNAARHRLAHRLPRHARAHRPVDVPRPALGARHRRVPARLRAPTTARPTPPARAACSRRVIARARALGYDADASAPSSSSSSSRRRPRRSTPRASAASSRSRPACSATRGCARGRTPTSATPSSTTWRRFGIPIEGLHTETGPGVYEVAIKYDEALRSADKAALFKTAMKQVAFAPRLRGHLHGQVEPRSPRLERAPAPVALEGRQERLLRRRGRRTR